MTADHIDIESSPEPLPSKRAWYRFPILLIGLTLPAALLANFFFDWGIRSSNYQFWELGNLAVLILAPITVIYFGLGCQSRESQNRVMVQGFLLYIPIMLAIAIMVQDSEQRIKPLASWSGDGLRFVAFEELETKPDHYGRGVQIYREEPLFWRFKKVTPVHRFNQSGEVDFQRSSLGSLSCVLQSMSGQRLEVFLDL